MLVKSINRLHPPASFFDDCFGIVIPDAFGDQGDDAVIGVVADMGVQWVGELAETEGVENFGYIDIDVGDVDTKPRIQIFFGETVRYGVT